MGLKKLDSNGNIIESNVQIQIVNRDAGKILRYCRGCASKPFCGVLLDADEDEIRCKDCKKEYNREGNKRYKKIKDFYSSLDWIKKRKEIRERDLHMCAICISKDGIINEDIDAVHHIDSVWKSSNWDKRLDENNLISLCKDHHEAMNSNEYEFLYNLEGDLSGFKYRGDEYKLDRTVEDVVNRVMKGL